MKITGLKIVSLALALSSFACACNCGCKAKKEAAEGEKAPVEAVATASANEVVIKGDDTMKFDVSAIEIKAGEATKIVFKNVGKLPKAAMGHNLVILKPDADINKFGMGAAGAAATEYIPQDEELKAMVVANTKVLGPGEEDTIEVTLEAGEYPFICSFPGHFAMMKGVITVK